MEYYSKYLSSKFFSSNWGLTVLNVGCGTVSDNCDYPPSQHPENYYFNWDEGRVLDEYQLIFITKGKGAFESPSAGNIELKPGSAVLLFPGEWHRYKPDENTGWKEYWVGFRGEIADKFVNNGFFYKTNPVLPLGLKPDIIKLYQTIITYTQNESAECQPLASSAVIHLLGMIYSFNKQNLTIQANSHHHELIENAKSILLENIASTTNIEEIADRLQVSYSLFRKMFKNNTGISPGQYLIQLRLDRAKDLLAYTTKLIKEIAFELHFESECYFSKLFKRKVGISPVDYRMQHRS